MEPNLIGGGLIDLVDDWLLKQKPQLGAGQSPPPGPGPQAPSRIGAAQPQAPPQGATPPFMPGPAYDVPAKIGAGPVAPDTTAQPPNGQPARIGAPMPTAPDTTAAPPAAGQPPAKIGGMFTAPDTSLSPPTADQPPARIGGGETPAQVNAGSAGGASVPAKLGAGSVVSSPGAPQTSYLKRFQDWEAQEPKPLDPNAGKPSTLRKIGGIAAGAAIGAFNPEAGAKIGSSIVSGPRHSLEFEQQQREQEWERKGKLIGGEERVAHEQEQSQQKTVESGGRAYEWNPATQRYDIPVGSLKEQKPENLDREAYDYYISKGMTPADARKRVLADAADQKPQKFTNPFEAFAYGTAEQKKAAQDFIAFEKQQGARYERPGEVEQRYALYQKDPDAFKAMYGDRAAAQGSRDEAQATRMLRFFDAQRKEIQSGPNSFMLNDEEKQQKLAEIQELEKPYLDAAQLGGANAGGNAGGGTGPRKGEVEVINPNGEHGYIPRANLQKALGRGYKQANQ